MRILLVLIVSLSLAGCAATQTKPVDPATLAGLAGKTLILVKRESPSFVAMTSNKGMFAVVVVAAAGSAGNDPVQQKNIADPAMAIATSLGQTLKSSHGMRVVGETSAVSASGDLNEIVGMSGRNGYALDVVTNGWSYIYDGFKFSDYFVGYSANLRLIDMRTSEVVSTGFCAYDPKKAGKSTVTHDTLMKNNAAYIKLELADAARFCTQQFIAALF